MSPRVTLRATGCGGGGLSGLPRRTGGGCGSRSVPALLALCGLRWRRGLRGRVRESQAGAPRGRRGRRGGREPPGRAEGRSGEAACRAGEAASAAACERGPRPGARRWGSRWAASGSRAPGSSTSRRLSTSSRGDCGGAARPGPRAAGERRPGAAPREASISSPSTVRGRRAGGAGAGGKGPRSPSLLCLFCCWWFNWRRAELPPAAVPRFGGAGVGPARSRAGSSGPEEPPPGLGTGPCRHPGQELGGTAGNHNSQRSVAVTTAVPCSGFVYKGKCYMCFVFLFTEALVTCPSRSVSLCCYIAPDRANGFVLAVVL